AQRAEGDAEELGGLGAHAARALECLQDETTLDLADDGLEIAAGLGELEERGARGGGRAGERRRESAERDRRTLGERDGALDGVLELAHVAWERVRKNRAQGLGRDAAHLLALLVGEAMHEMIDEGAQILGARSERRHLDADDVEAVVEVLAE